MKGSRNNTTLHTIEFKTVGEGFTPYVGEAISSPIFDAVKRIVTYYPSFAKLVQKGCLGSSGKLDLPVTFISRYLEGSRGHVILEDEDAVMWNVQWIGVMQSERRLAFTVGWPEFVSAQNIHEKDFLIFQVLTPVHFKVHIIYTSDFGHRSFGSVEPPPGKPNAEMTVNGAEQLCLPPFQLEAHKNIWKGPVERKSSQMPFSDSSTLLNTKAASLTSGLDQLVQASLLSGKVYEEQSPWHSTTCNPKRHSNCRHSKQVSNCVKKSFDKQKAYQARFCESIRDSCCPHYALHGFRFCIRHILEDPSAPYKQCDYFELCTQTKCTLPVSVNLVDTRFCQLHKLRTNFGDSIGLKFLNRVFALGAFCSAVMTVAVAHELTGEMYALIDEFCISTNQESTLLAPTEVISHEYEGTDMITRGLESHLKLNLEDLRDAITERACVPSGSTRDDTKNIAMKLNNATREGVKENEMAVLSDVRPLNSTQMRDMETPPKWQDSRSSGNESTFNTGIIDTTMGLSHASDRVLTPNQDNMECKERREGRSHGKRIRFPKFLGVRKRPSGAYGAEIRTPDGKRLWLGTFPTEEEAAYAYDDAARIYLGKSAATNFDDSQNKSDTPEHEPMALKRGRISTGRGTEENNSDKTTDCEKCEAGGAPKADISLNTSKEEPESPRNQYDGDIDSSSPGGVNMAAEIDDVSDQKLEETLICPDSRLEGNLGFIQREQTDASKASLMYSEKDSKENDHDDAIKNVQSKAVEKEDHRQGLEGDYDFTSREPNDATNTSSMSSKEDSKKGDHDYSVKSVQYKTNALKRGRSSTGEGKEEKTLEETRNCEKCEVEGAPEDKCSVGASNEEPCSLRNQKLEDGTQELENPSGCVGLKPEDLLDDFTQREQENAPNKPLMHSKQVSAEVDHEDAFPKMRSRAAVKQYYSRPKQKFRNLSSSTATGIEADPEHSHKIVMETETSVLSDISDFELQDFDDDRRAKDSKKSTIRNGGDSSNSNNFDRKRKRRAMDDPHLLKAADAALNAADVKDEISGVVGSSENGGATDKNAPSSMPYRKEDVSDEPITLESKDNQEWATEGLDASQSEKALNEKPAERLVTRRSQKPVQPSNTTSQARRRSTLYGFNSDYYIESEYSRVYKTTSRQRALVRNQ